MDKKEFLKKINGGYERGARVKLAKMLGLTLPGISNWFAGRDVPSPQNIDKMARLFDMSPEEVRSVFYDDNTRNNFFENSGTIANADNKSNLSFSADDKHRITLLEKDIELIKKTQENFNLRLRLLEIEKNKK